MSSRYAMIALALLPWAGSAFAHGIAGNRFFAGAITFDPRRRRLPGSGMESGQTHADAVLANDRLRTQAKALVPVAVLSGCRTTQRLICETSIATPGPRLPASFRRCRAAPVGRTRRSPSSCGGSRTGIADELREERTRRVLGE